jgi:hypothetical protein
VIARALLVFPALVVAVGSISIAVGMWLVPDDSEQIKSRLRRWFVNELVDEDERL